MRAKESTFQAERTVSAKAYRQKFDWNSKEAWCFWEVSKVGLKKQRVMKYRPKYFV